MKKKKSTKVISRNRKNYWYDPEFAVLMDKWEKERRKKLIEYWRNKHRHD